MLKCNCCNNEVHVERTAGETEIVVTFDKQMLEVLTMLDKHGEKRFEVRITLTPETRRDLINTLNRG